MPARRLSRGSRRGAQAAAGWARCRDRLSACRDRLAAPAHTCHVRIVSPTHPPRRRRPPLVHLTRRPASLAMATTRPTCPVLTLGRCDDNCGPRPHSSLSSVFAWWAALNSYYQLVFPAHTLPLTWIHRQQKSISLWSVPLIDNDSLLHLYQKVQLWCNTPVSCIINY